MKNKAFPLPSINSSPAIPTSVSAGDSYYLHTQTLRVPGREGSHRLWLHQRLVCLLQHSGLRRIFSPCWNDKKAPKARLGRRWSGSSAWHQQPLQPFHGTSKDRVKANHRATQAEKQTSSSGVRGTAPSLQLRSCQGARDTGNKLPNLGSLLLLCLQAEFKNKKKKKNRFPTSGLHVPAFLHTGHTLSTFPRTDSAFFPTPCPPKPHTSFPSTHPAPKRHNTPAGDTASPCRQQ